MVGSRGVREEVEGSCSWVAILAAGNPQLLFLVCLFTEKTTW